MQHANETQQGGLHYKRGNYQLWDWAIDINLTYVEGCIAKYVYRWRDKDGLRDLNKAYHFSQKLIEAFEGQKHKPRDVNREIIEGYNTRFFKESKMDDETCSICSLISTWNSKEDLIKIKDSILNIIQANN